MIPLTFLYDEYIDRPKLTEQKKPILVYGSYPSQVGSEQKWSLYMSTKHKQNSNYSKS